MRFIRTQNNYVEFIEADSNGKVLSSRGFQLGELYFKINNQKVTFYLNDQENPWRNDVWTTNIPLILDGVTYETEDEASAALSKIMVLEDINELKERLDAEILRSTNEDTKHDVLISGLTDDISDLADEIEAETARALSAETRLEDKIDAEVSRAIQKENAILNKVNLNTERISGLSDALDVEIQNRIAGDTQLQNNIGIEADDRRHADVILMNLISGLTDDLNDEIVRSTAKDAEHDALLSGLTNDLEGLEDKVDEAISAHTMIVQKLDDEISRAYSAETLINQALANEVVRAVSAETRIELKLDNEIQERKDADIVLSGAIDSLSAYCEDTYAKKEDLDALEDKVDEAISSITDDLQAEIARATARENDIAEDLDDEFHRAQSAEHLLEDKIVTERERAIGVENELRELIDNIEVSGVTEDDMKDYVSGYTYSKDESDAKYQSKLTAGENISIVNNVISAKDTTYSAGTNVQINGNVISATDTKYSAGTNVQISGNVISAKDTTYSAGSGIDITNNVISVTGGSQPVDAYTKAESDAKFATINNFNSHSGNTTVHITSAERTKWNNKPDIWSGTEAQWAQISGGTLDNNTIYLVY